MAREDALRYAIAPLAHGVRRAVGVELWKQSRSELVPRLKQTFGGAEELKAALEDAFERALQSVVIGLKSPWLLMETGEKDYCEAFSKNLREPFTQEAQVEGRLLIDFLDGFFLDYDTALDAAPVILGLPDTSEDEFFERLLDAGDSTQDANELAALASETIHDGFVTGVGLEAEHPIVRLARWRDLLADGIIFHFADIARSHPSWSRYLDVLDEERLARQDMRAVASRDDTERARVAQARGLLSRIESYRSAFGDIIPNREWLFEVADRLEDSDETVESDLLMGRSMLARDLPLVVNAAVGKVAEGHGLAPMARFSDALLEPKASTIEVLRRARRDFRRCHWTGEGYAPAAYQLGSLIFSVLGPRGAERYFREALAFRGDAGACEHALFLSALALEDRRAAIHHLQAAVAANADLYEPFDLSRYKLDAILGAGGAGMSFLVATEDGKDLVVKTLWDEIAVTDPRPALKELQALVKAKVPGTAKIHHLCGYKKRVTFVVSDFVAGDDLETFRETQGGEAPVRVVVDVGVRAAEILAAAHGAGVLHRNLKPGNVRIGAGEEGLEVTLLDFAVPNAVLVHPERIRGVRRLAGWSRLGRQIAEDLAAYTAPEVLKGGLDASTASADIYSLGATLYRFATGASPRRVDAAGLPAEIRDIIVRCLAKDPAARPGTSEEVRDALLRARARLDDPSAAVADAPEAPNLTESQEDEFGLAGLTTAPGAPGRPGPSPFAPPAPDPFGAPDPFAPPAPAPAAPGLRGPRGAPPPAPDPFAPSADPFGAPDPFAPQADPFGAPPAGDAFMPAGTDPFGAPAGADPFGAAQGAPAADPFAPGADPFAPGADLGGADAFAPGGDPFAPTAYGAPPPAAPGRPAGRPPAPGADPFGAAADPFAPAADPFAPASDPFAPAGNEALAAANAFDPFGGANALDPFAPTASGDDPFAGAGTGVLRTQDPFALPAPKPATPKPMPRPAKKAPGDEEEEEALDPMEALALLQNLMTKKGPATATKKKPVPAKPAARPGAPRAAPPAASPLGAPVDPFAPGGAPIADPFAPAGADPFAPAGADPFAPAGADPFAPAGADPFAPAAADPFAPVADPFAPVADPFAPVADPFAPAADPFAAQPGPSLSESQQISDPLAGAGNMMFSAEIPGMNLPDLAVPGEDLPVLSTEEPPAPAPPPPTKPAPRAAPAGAKPGAAKPGAAKPGAKKPGAAPARPAREEKKVDEEGYGLVVSGLELKSKKEAAIVIICEIRGISREEAYELCRSPVVPVLKQKTKEEVEAAEAKFKAAKVQCRITQRKDRR
jgi:hypothetical protein